MRIPRLFAATLFLVFCTQNTFGQSSPAQPAAAENAAQTETAAIYITVANKKGTAIGDLKPEDITITENKVPAKIASSEGRCNTCLQFTRWSLKSQGLSWTLIQAQRDLVELRLSDGSQIGSSREVLPQEQIGVFVCATLPGALWIAEVDLHIGSNRKRLVLGHLQSAIPRQRAPQGCRKLTNAFAQRRHHHRRVFTRHLDQHEEA